MTLPIEALVERGGPYSVYEAKRVLGISWQEIATAVRDRVLRSTVLHGRYYLDHDDVLNYQRRKTMNTLFSDLKNSQSEETGEGEDDQVWFEHYAKIINYSSKPEAILEYLEFHGTINRFTWLLKTHYCSGPELRDRDIRIDRMFARYLKENKVSLEKLARLRYAAASGDVAWSSTGDSLKKVWYNELSYLQPALPQYIDVDYRGVQANLAASQSRLLFLSWKVTQAYYAVYHAFRSLCDSLQVPYDPKEHHAPMRAFKATKLMPATRVLMFFPFDMACVPARPDERPTPPPTPPYARFKYARYPRDRHVTMPNLIHQIWFGLAKGAEQWPPARHRNERFMLPDYLYNFRTWANYVNIDNLVDLKSRGYKSYMDLDLYVLTFFYAAFAELMALAIYGEDRFTTLAEDFHTRFVHSDATLSENSSPWPMAVRFKVYKELGLLSPDAWEPERQVDPNRLDLETLDR